MLCGSNHPRVLSIPLGLHLAAYSDPAREHFPVILANRVLMEGPSSGGLEGGLAGRIFLKFGFLVHPVVGILNPKRLYLSKPLMLS